MVLIKADTFSVGQPVCICVHVFQNDHSLLGFREVRFITDYLHLHQRHKSVVRERGRRQLTDLCFTCPDSLHLCVTSCLERGFLIRLLVGCFFSLSLLQSHALSFIPGLSITVPWFSCFLFPITPGKAAGEINRCQHSNTFQLRMPGHSRTSLAFLHLKVQHCFVPSKTTSFIQMEACGELFLDIRFSQCVDRSHGCTVTLKMRTYGKVVIFLCKCLTLMSCSKQLKKST